MGLLAADVLVLGGGLLAALLATYLLKPRRPARPVSSTLLWLAALHQRHADRPWRRVPPSLLLALQVAGLAAIVAALARPFVLSPESTGLDAVVLLDASAAMRATDVSPSRFEAARAHVAQLIDNLQPGQTLSLVSVADEARLLSPRSDDKALLRQALAAAEPVLQAPNFTAALSLAATLAEGHPEAQVIIVGSGGLDRRQVPATFPLAVRFVGVGASAENTAIAAFGTRVIEGTLASLARVANYGALPREVSLELRVDGARFDTRVLTLGPGSAADVEWNDVPIGARVLEAHLVEPDAFEVDNTAWSVVGGDRPTRVLLISGGNIFLERALALRPGVQVTRATSSSYTADALSARPFDLVVADGVLPAELPAAASLLTLHPPARSSLLSVGPDVAISHVEPGRVDQPILVDVPLPGIHISRARQLDVPVWADVVLDSPETPLLLLGEQAGRRTAVLGFDVHDSDLPLQPAFPVLVQRLLDWLVPRGSVVSPVIHVGEAATLAPLPETQTVDVLTPDGRRVRAAPPLPIAPFTDSLVAGVYTVLQGVGVGHVSRSQ
ncbi:MAG: VWA domain-containing protein, partial [Chloroflexota bacterium]|nr:VWA domain-containing protein [Chloroflexota bacterium]